MPKLSATELDFDQIKTNLKTFLSNQALFQDYDFEGSGMSIILDLLAYNTHYMALQANLTANEMFLDSATLRESIVSLAKHLNYTPTSATAPVAKLNLILKPTDTPSSINIDKGTKFTTTVDNINYNFVNLKTYTIIPDLQGVYSINDVEIKEGKILSFSYTKDSTDSQQRFLIPNKNVDTATISVVVQTSSTDTTTNTFTAAKETTLITGTDKVYWIQEVEDEKWEIYFGDGTVGQALTDGNIITIEYHVTKGDAANKALTFKQSTTVGGLTSDLVTITTSQIASNGSAIQTKEDVAFLAPKLYSTQGRAVTTIDYKNVLLKERTDIDSITVWGGEDASPVAYGTVNIAIKPNNASVYSDAIKTDIINQILKTRSIVSITPKIIDPIYTYINITSSINYDPVVLTTTSTELQSGIETVIKNYFTSTLSKFDIKFRHSIISGLIDKHNKAIRNNSTIVTMEMEANPLAYTTSYTHILNFSNEIEKGTLSSLGFTDSAGNSCFIDDDSAGNIRSYKLVGTSKVYINTTVGTIDYTTGLVTLINFFASALANNEAGTTMTKLIIRVKPAGLDLLPVREQLLTLDATRYGALNVTVVSESDE